MVFVMETHLVREMNTKRENTMISIKYFEWLTECSVMLEARKEELC